MATVELRRDDVQRLVREGAQLGEVLSRQDYENEHIPGAISMPLGRLAAEAHRLGRDRAVVVYCYDCYCDVSARAAARLETLGFEHVFRYTGGKIDWFAAGLPREGRLASQPRAGDVARADVPTCRLRDRVRDVAQEGARHRVEFLRGAPR